MSKNDKKMYKTTRIIEDNTKFPDFKKPEVIGVFSVDKNRRFLLDTSQLKYLAKSPMLSGGKVNLDLNEGIMYCVRKNELANEKLDHIFEWIRDEGNKMNKLSKADFVCFRGLLNTLMRTPYEKQEGWIISATKVNSTIYLCAFDTESQIHQKKNVSDQLKTFQSWGYKFEQFMLTDRPGQIPDTKKPVLETEEFACVFQSKLNGHNIIYAAEMDGVLSDEVVDSDKLKTNKISFFELKTNRHIESQRQDNNFKRKLLKWWGQSFLVGIETIYCGFRDDYGIVTAIKEYKVQNLPKMAKNYWNPCVCMNFCAQFLDFVKACMQESSTQHTHWKFEWYPGNLIKGQEIDKNSEYSFVPDFYYHNQ